MGGHFRPISSRRCRTRSLEMWRNMANFTSIDISDMKRPPIILTFLLLSIFSLSAQTRLGPAPRIINRAENYHYALDSLFLGEEYSKTLLGVAMITQKAFGSSACLRTNYDSAKKKYELVYLVRKRETRGRKGRTDVTTYRCTISSETFLELSDLFSSAVYASLPGSVVYGGDGVIYEFLDGESLFFCFREYDC